MVPSPRAGDVTYHEECGHGLEASPQPTGTLGTAPGDHGAYTANASNATAISAELSAYHASNPVLAYKTCYLTKLW